MAKVNVRKIGDIPYYKGEGSIPGIKFHTAARELGVTAWGMNVIEIEAGCTAYPEHDHTKDGQEEVYVVLRGSGTISVGGEQIDLIPDLLVRVESSEKRKILPGSEGITILAVGGTPGKAYEPR